MTSPEAPTPKSAAPRLEIVRVDDQHAEPVAEFFRQVWDPAATAASVLAGRHATATSNVVEPGTPAPTWIALQGGRCLGYVTTIPVQAWNGTNARPAYLMKGLMVLPEFRGGPIGYHVLKAATAALPTAAGFAVAPPARRLFEALGYRDYGAIPNLIRPLRSARILQRVDLDALGLAERSPRAVRALTFARRTGLATLIGGTGQLLVKLTAALRRVGAPRAEIVTMLPSRDDVDRLWQSAQAGLASAVMRDGAYLRQRYSIDGDSPYRWITVRDGARLSGIAIVRQPRSDGDERLRGIRIATLADILYPIDRPAIGLALLGASERLGLAMGGDAIVASASSPAFTALLRRQWYLPLGGNVHFLWRDASKIEPPVAGALEQWFLTRGDGAADEAF